MTWLSALARVAGLLYILASVVGALRLVYIPKDFWSTDRGSCHAVSVSG